MTDGGDDPVTGVPKWRRGIRASVVALVLVAVFGLAACGEDAPVCGECGPTLVASDGAGVVAVQGRTLWRLSDAGERSGGVALFPERRSSDAAAVTVDPAGVTWVASSAVLVRVAPGGSVTRTPLRPAARVTGIVADAGGVWLSAGRRVLRITPRGVPAVRSPALPVPVGLPMRAGDAVWVHAGERPVALDASTLRPVTDPPPAPPSPGPRAAGDPDLTVARGRLLDTHPGGCAPAPHRRHRPTRGSRARPRGARDVTRRRRRRPLGRSAPRRRRPDRPRGAVPHLGPHRPPDVNGPWHARRGRGSVATVR